MRVLLLVVLLAAVAASAWLLLPARPSAEVRPADGDGGAGEEGADLTYGAGGVRLEPGARVRRDAAPPSTGRGSGPDRGMAPGASSAREQPARMPGGVAHLTLVVRAADGTPIPRADVNVLDAQGMRMARVVDGRLVVSLRELDGRLGLQVLQARGRSDEPLDLGWSVLELTAAAADATVEVELPRGRTLAGQVVDDLGAPAVGVKVLVRPTLSEAWRGGPRTDATLQATTDAQGYFELRGLGAGEVLVEAIPLPTLQPAAPVPALAGSESVRITLARAAEAAVRVLDARGEPVAKAVVWARPTAPTTHGVNPLGSVGYGSENLTDAQGVWRVPHLDPGGVYHLSVDPPRDRPELQRFARSDWRPEAQTTVRLESGPTVRGRVLDTRGAPYPGARAHWRQGTRWSALTLAQDGTFVAGGLEPGSVTLRASSSPDALHQDIQGLETFAERTVLVGSEDVELRVARTYKLEVTLVGLRADSGLRAGQLHAQGLRGGRTWHVSSLVRTGGVLVFDGLEPEGTYTVWFQAGDVYALREGLKADTGHVEVALERGVPIQGRVEIPAGAKRADVQAFLKDRPFHVGATPDANGRFSLPGLPPDTRWRVVATYRSDTYRSVVTEDVAAGSDMGTVTPR